MEWKSIVYHAQHTSIYKLLSFLLQHSNHVYLCRWIDALQILTTNIYLLDRSMCEQDVFLHSSFAAIDFSFFPQRITPPCHYLSIYMILQVVKKEIIKAIFVIHLTSLILDSRIYHDYSKCKGMSGTNRALYNVI